jgi:two-component system sensor histidine kinase TctE
MGVLDMRRVVEGVADEWVHRALARDIDLGFELAEARVRGSEFLLREALANLIHNALEYVPAGGHVTVRTGTHASDGGSQATLEVEDDGPGIPPAERELVVQRFYRIPGTSGTGSGLGLSIVSEIAASHDARLEIGATTPDGRGCKVSLIFRAVSP